MHLLAAEGGYQAFNLGGTDKALLVVSLLIALVGLRSGRQEHVVDALPGGG